MDYYGPITPEENELFTRALRFLYERRLAMEGFKANIIVTRITPEEADASNVPA